MSLVYLTQLLLGSLLGLGIISTGLGFVGWLYLPWSSLLTVPTMLLTIIFWRTLFQFKSLSKVEKLLLTCLVGIWLLHFLQVLMPETGFDAVWYHLPIVEQFVQAHRIFYLPKFYQSLNPLFSDLIFLLGYQLRGDLGAKLIAYFLSVSLILVSYQLSRQFLNRSWSLLTVAIISTFQVVAWQSASFYVDNAKALWEVASLWLMMKGLTKSSALMFGAALATKLFSLFLMPIMLMSVWLTGAKQKVRAAMIFAVLSLTVALPFYIFTFLYTGNPVYGLTINTRLLTMNQLIDQTIRLPYSLVVLTWARDYTTPLFLVLCPIFIFWLIKAKHPVNQLTLLIFASWQYFIWWYLPPTSTRYALSGFICLLISYLTAAQWLIKKNSAYRWPIFLTIFFLTSITLAPRILVAQRSLNYLLGKQTRKQYIQQFDDGWIDQPLQQWHQL